MRFSRSAINVDRFDRCTCPLVDNLVSGLELADFVPSATDRPEIGLGFAWACDHKSTWMKTDHDRFAGFKRKFVQRIGALPVGGRRGR